MKKSPGFKAHVLEKGIRIDMCGIGGIVSNVSRPLGIIQKMMDAQAHRGPDGEGFLGGGEEGIFLNPVNISAFWGKWVLGHRRLSILDLSPDGAQPMSYGEGGHGEEHLWITYNGELYNYLELKTELMGRGYVFKTGTDTEVVLAAYRAWGVSCFERFNGMWALAILNTQTNTLILSRDRFGEKPLHLLQDKGALFFASEIKGILAAYPEKELFLNASLAADYVRWGMVGHTNQTFFQEIEVFPPASYAVINLESPTKWMPQKFWDISQASKASDLDSRASDIDFVQAKKSFRDLFFSSLELRMRSDVPLGFCLSGGLDSSSIVSCAASRVPKTPKAPLRTFTSVSNLPQYSEQSFADIINGYVGARPSYIQPEVDGFIQDLPRLLWHQEEPFSTTSIYAQWRVMARAREERVPVLLDGQGADESLCGYRKFYLFYLRDLLKGKKIGKLGEEILSLFAKGDRQIFRLFDGVRYLPRFLREKLAPAPAFIEAHFLQSTLDLSSPPSDLGSSPSLRERQINDLTRYSLPSLLRYEDRNSMAWSIESRLPFLDHRLVAFLLSLPAHCKMRKGRSKYIMREALKDFVPQQILQRRNKMGFGAPQDVWMKGRLGSHIISALGKDRSSFSAFINKVDLKKNLQEGRHLDVIFRVFILDQWSSQFNISLKSYPLSQVSSRPLRAQG